MDSDTVLDIDRPDSRVVNYPDIYESLALILEEECPEKRDAILDSLDDAVGNNADALVLEDDP